MSDYGSSVLSPDGKEQWTSDSGLLTFSRKVATTPSSRVWVSMRTPVAYEPSEGSTLNSLRNNVSESVETWPNGQNARMTYSTGSGNIVYYDESPPVISSGYGLAAYSNLGILDFSSDQKPLKILDIVDIPDIRQVAVTVNGIPTYWRKSYPGLSVACMFINYPIFQDWLLYTAAPSLRGGVFAMERAVYDNVTVNDIGNWASTWSLRCLIVDVTGY